MKEERLLTANSEFGNSRYLLIKGEPWFAAKDICDVLNLTNSRKATAALDEDEKDVATIHTLGGPQQMTIVNETGLYNLIFQSRKPEAKAFKKWVTSEVLPSIRRNGYYINPNAVLSIKERNAMMRNFHKELDRHITGEDVYKLAKRYRCTEGRVEAVLHGGVTDIHLMRELQECALENRANRVDVYADQHIRKILDALK